MKRGLASIFLILILILSITVIAAEDDIRGEDLDKQPTTDATSNDLGTNTKTTTTDTQESGLANSYQWLYDTITNRTVNDADEAAAIIALLGESSGELGGLVEELKKRENENHCWPKEGCRVKDTALGTLALSLSGQDVTEEVKWLKESKISMGNKGEWWIVLKSNTNGTCVTTYNTKQKNFDIQDDIIKQARGQYHINLLDIDPNINRVVTPKISVDCSTMPNVIIALVYKPDTNTFFIQESQSVTNTDLIINNACYPISRRTNTCDFESTAFATWALLELQTEEDRENIGTTIYLESSVKQGDSIQLALLNRVLLKLSNVQQSFLELLVQQQRQDGSFNNDVYATSLSLLGLQGTDKTDNIARAADYLTRRVSKDGSWNRDVRNTAYALLALHGTDLGRREVKPIGGSSGRREICGNGIDDNQNGIEDCGEQLCSDDQSCKCVNNKQDGDEEGIDCGGNCGNKCADTTDGTETTGCILDSDCNSGEGCQSGICIIKNDDTDATLPTSTDEGSSWWIWLLIILLILLAGFGVFYVKYVKTGKIVLKDIFKKKKKQTFDEYRRMSEFKPAQPRPMNTQNNNQRIATQPRITPQRAIKSKEEEELERSLKEAEKLIKGK